MLQSDNMTQRWGQKPVLHITMTQQAWGFVALRMQGKAGMMQTLTSEVGGMQRVCRWRVKREDMICLPPPGGAQAAMPVPSSRLFQNSLLRA